MKAILNGVTAAIAIASACGTFAAVAANALRSMNVPPDSTITEIIIPANAGPEGM